MTKRRKHILWTGVFAVVLGLWTVSCAATAEVMRLDNVQRPARSVEQVRLFLEEPSEKYAAVALIEVRDEGWGHSLETLRRKLVFEAARLGADAVILTRQSSDAGSVLVPVGAGWMAAKIEERKLIGKVIVFDR